MHIRHDLLHFIVVVKLKVLKLQTVHVVAMFVENGGGRNYDICARKKVRYPVRCSSGIFADQIFACSAIFAGFFAGSSVPGCCWAKAAAHSSSIRMLRITLVWHIAMSGPPFH